MDEESKGSQLGWKSLTDRQTRVFLNIDLFLNILRKRDWNKKQIKKMEIEKERRIESHVQKQSVLD